MISVGSEVQIFPGPPLSSVKFCRVKVVTNGRKSEKRHIHKKLKEAVKSCFAWSTRAPETVRVIWEWIFDNQVQE